jgi:anti-sigma-K factor RskA
MNREQADELLGAYALDALPETEAAELRAYLATDAAMAAKARELRAVASTLALEFEDVAPPAGLRAKVVDAVAASGQGTVDRGQGVSAPAPASIEQRRPTPEDRASRGGWRPVAFAFGALAAALAIAVAGLLAWNISLRNESASLRVPAIAPLQQETGATAGYAVVFEDGTMSVVGDAFPLLDESQTYQLWAISDAGEATSLGLMPPVDGVPRTKVEFDRDEAVQIAVTVEPAGGSEQPTSEPLYAARI